MSNPPAGGTAVGAPSQTCPVPSMCRLTVTVVCANETPPVPSGGALVEITGPTQRPPRRTSDAGEAVFNGVAPGAYTVTATKDNHTGPAAPVPVTVVVGQPASVTIPLTRGPLTAHLQLRYQDPGTLVGVSRPFPAGFPVTVRIGGAEQTVNTLDEGRLTFEVPTGQDEVQLAFRGTTRRYIAVKSELSTQAANHILVEEANLGAVEADHYHAFLLPPTDWSMAVSDWKVENYDRYEDFTFKGLNRCEVTFGTQDQPVRCILNPHWNYLRFEYFDRRFGHTTYGDQRICVPPLMIEGYRTAPAGGATPAVNTSDTRSNWAEDWTGSRLDSTRFAQEGCIALPWIIRRTAAGVAEPKPDANVLLMFRTDDDHRFIESRADGTRLYTRLAPGHAHHRASADRLRYYDMPAIWKSKRYFARLTTTNRENRYEQIAAERTGIADPLTFSLDDIVLTDNTLNPIAWTPPDRCAIYVHNFTRGTDLSFDGLYKADTANNNATTTQQPVAPAVERDRNYISDYPNWTRLVLAFGNMFDVFDRRTADNAAADRVVGARAAVRLVDATAPFPNILTFDFAANAYQADRRPIPGRMLVDANNTPNDGRPNLSRSAYFAIQPFYSHTHVRGTQTSRGDTMVGRYDQALLRCCDVDGDAEVAVSLMYLRLGFNFAPPAGPAMGPSAIPVNAPNGSPNLPTQAAQRQWADDMIQRVLYRWNDHARFTPAVPDYNPGVPQAIPRGAAAPDVKINILWIVQSLPMNQSHFSINVFTIPTGSAENLRVRASMGTNDGTSDVDVKDNLLEAGGVFTMAHECGHAIGNADEYGEPNFGASYYQDPFYSDTPGAPYIFDDFAMMRSSRVVRPRCQWHVVEWLRPFVTDGAGATRDWQLNHGIYRYQLPHHRTARRTYVTAPLTQQTVAGAAGARPHYDILVYRLGDEHYTRGFLPHANKGQYDGLIIILVKMRFRFHNPFAGAADTAANRHAFIRGGLASMIQQIRGRFNGKFCASGDFTNAAQGLNEHFNRALLVFSPRCLVETFSGDAQYGLDVGINPANQANYTTRVNSVATNHARHFEVRTRAAGATAWDAGNARLAHYLFDNTPATAAVMRGLFAEMLGLTFAQSATPNSYDPIVGNVLANASVVDASL